MLLIRNIKKENVINKLTGPLYTNNSIKLCAAPIFLLSAFFVAIPFSGASAVETPLAVEEIANPAYAMPGVKVGAFTLNASVASAVTYDSNIFESTDPDSDVIYLVAPKLEFKSNFVRHSLEIDLNFEHIEYDQSSDDSVSNYGIEARSRIDIHDGLNLTVNLLAQVDHEDRTDQDRDLAGNAEAPKFKEFDVEAELRRNFNRLELAAGVHYSKEDYFQVRAEGGGVNLLADQDVETVDLTAEISYRLTPRVTTGTSFSYEIENNLGDNDRDRKTWSLEHDIDFRISSKTTLELAYGYSVENFDNDLTDGDDLLPLYRARLNWRPSPFFDFVFSFAKEEEGTDFESDLSGAINTSYGVAVTYRPRRHVELISSFEYELSEFEEDAGGGQIGDGESDRYLYNFTAKYAVRQGINLSLIYNYEDQQSSRADDSFEQHVVQGGLKIDF